ncbi:uncharacterized protein [Procambarus clarkii]|uniref:uncharacterized protein n=1 Tax=Procambarus clarkii TaxID=6728 RepID=UPI001E6752B2|nr:uncharacterized protein LOC123761822 [Procambarus clarkii]
MWSLAATLAVVAAAATVVAGEPEAVAGGVYAAPLPIPAKCYPKVVWVTKYEQILKEVPVPNKVFKTELIPTVTYLNHVEKVYQDVYLTKYLPKYVTSVVYLPQVQYVTDYKINYLTDYKPVYVTKKEVLPKYVTQTYVESIIKNQVVYDTVYETKVLPQYITKLDVAYQTVYKTNLVPQFHTVYDTKYVEKTVCPKVGY